MTYEENGCLGSALGPLLRRTMLEHIKKIHPTIFAFDSQRTFGRLRCLFRPRPHEVSLVGLSNIRVSGVSVLEMRIVFGRSSAPVSNQAWYIQAAA
jgi:hypothetical protein